MNSAARDSELVDRVRAVLARHDPMKLVNQPTPDDQYADEADTLARRLATCPDVEQILDAVYFEFCPWLGADPETPRETFRAVADDLWAARPTGSTGI